MIYLVGLTRPAQKELSDLPAESYRRVKAAIAGLATNPRPPGAGKLNGREGWRIRVGDYRILYLVNDDAHSVTVIRIRHRREVYR